MLAISLIFVGISLTLNGFFLWNKLNKRILIILNLFTGLIIFTFSLYSILATPQPDLISNFGAMLFGLTSLLIAFDIIFKNEMKPFGYFCLLATVCAVCISVYYFVNDSILRGSSWAVWSLIWLFSYIGFGLNRRFTTPTYAMLIAQGIITTGIFGLLQLFGVIVF